jgi:hypothetical protein
LTRNRLRAHGVTPPRPAPRPAPPSRPVGYARDGRRSSSRREPSQPWNIWTFVHFMPVVVICCNERT